MKFNWLQKHAWFFLCSCRVALQQHIMRVGILKNIIPTNIFFLFPHDTWCITGKKKTLKKLTTDLMPCKALGGGLYSNLAWTHALPQGLLIPSSPPPSALPYTKYSIWRSDKKITRCVHCEQDTNMGVLRLDTNNSNMKQFWTLTCTTRIKCTLRIL